MAYYCEKASKVAVLLDASANINNTTVKAYIVSKNTYLA